MKKYLFISIISFLFFNKIQSQISNFPIGDLSTNFSVENYLKNIDSISPCPPIDSTIQNITIYQGHSITIGNHFYTAAGIYRDTFTTEDSLCDSIVIITYLNVINGIDEETTISVAIYPNPTNHFVNIDLYEFITEPVLIFDIYGKTIFTSELDKKQMVINTESWYNGTYFVLYKNKPIKLFVNH